MSLSPDNSSPIIGVLALQGDFAAHGRRLEELGVPWRRVRLPEELAGLSGLILPGGESTTLLKLLAQTGLDRAITRRHAEGMPIFGTCAGLILLARQVLHPNQPSLGLLDVTVERNAYGRQVDSFEAEATWLAGPAPEPLEAVFIRAPRICACGPGVHVLATLGDEIIAVQEGSVMGATFHPELSAQKLVHAYFLGLCREPLARR